MHFTHLACAGAVMALAFACGSSSTDGATSPTTPPGSDADGGGTSSGGDGGGVGLDGGVAPQGSYAVDFGPVTAAAGEESTKCIVKRLGNPDSMHVGTVHNVLSQGSHHMIVYRVNDTAEVLTPFDCKPFTDTLDPTKGSTLMISQKKDDALVLPDGVAYTLDANQMIRIEMHYINPGAAPIQITSSSTFIPIDAAKVQHEADFLFIGTPDISIAPGQSTTVSEYITLPTEYDDVHFFAITGHEHQYGTDVVVASAASKDDPGTAVYDVPNWLWSEPATVQHDPPFSIPSGGGFHVSCSWNNTSASTVKFGESANDEMCFFWAYYYPSKGGAKVCAHTDQTGGAGVDACCPDTSSLVCAYLQNAN
jgi:hypothetical protein